MPYPILACPVCKEFASKQKKKFYNHLLESHGLDPEEAYIKFELFGKEFTCSCGCGCRPKWNGWSEGYTSYIRGHNARISSAFSDPAVTKRCVEKRMKSYRAGKYRVWSTGLTKENSETLRASAEKKSKTLLDGYRSGRIVSWQKGLTKDTDSRLARMSQTKREMFNSGSLVSWNEGLTKETDSRVAVAAKKISTKYKERLAGKRLSPGIVRERIELSGFTLLEEDYINKRESMLVVKCNVCDTVQNRTLYSLEKSFGCFTCKPKEPVAQIEIYEFVAKLCDDTLMSDREMISPYELDVVVPSAQLAIEYNGLYWHSDKYLQKNYHSMKSSLCNSVGYKLFHIFEDEWRDKKEIVKSMIKHRLGMSASKLGARKCQLIEIDAGKRREFFTGTHIDGDVPAKISFALIYDDNIVACLSLRRPFHKKWSEYMEVARISSGLDVVVAGGISRLVTHAMKWAHANGHTGLLSYVDTRHGNEDSYILSGFEKHGVTSDRFWWTDFSVRYNRFKIRADKATGLSEQENANRNGLRKIYGCPNLIMIKNE